MKSLIKIRGRKTSPQRRLRVLPIPVLLAVVCVFSCQNLSAAEGSVIAVQKALKGQQFYFGETNGVLDEPTRGALRRFQIRHGLPATAELDDATMNRLQNRRETSEGTAQVQPPETPAPSLIVAKDREFLQRLETGRDQIPSSVQTLSPPALPPPVVDEPVVLQSVPPRPSTTIARSELVAPRLHAPALKPSEPPAVVRIAQIAPPPAPPVASPSAKREVSKPKPEAQKSLPAEKPRWVATREVKQLPISGTNDSPQPREIPIRLNAPERIDAGRVYASTTRIANGDENDEDDDDDEDSRDDQRTRVIRTTTTTTSPDGRTYITERRTTTYSSTPAPIVRRLEPVRSRPGESFFQRIFRD